MANCKRMYALWLNAIEGIGAKRYFDICLKFGSPEAAYRNATKEDLLAIPNVGEKLASTFMDAKANLSPESTLESLSKHGAKAILLDDEEYPMLLREIADPPPVLYVLGDIDFNAIKPIAMVGTRRPTRYGREVAHHLAKELAEAGVTVVSGMARGIDACSHAGALAGGGKTIAVLGCGVNVVYPKENARLYEEIRQNGAVVSDYHFDVAPLGTHFPARNRIISGLSRGTVVVESQDKGGSLITADFAMDQGRDVFAVPGNITSPTSVGTNALIEDGVKMVLRTASILEEYPDWCAPKVKEPTMVQQKINYAHLDEDEIRVVELLKEGDLHFDVILTKCAMTSGELGAVLTIMELKGIIKQLPGRMYCIG